MSTSDCDSEAKTLTIIDFEGKKAVKKSGVPLTLDNEASILNQLNHPQIPKFLGWHADESILIEYIDGTDLFDYVEGMGFPWIEEKKVAKIIYDLAEIYLYIHSKSIAHLDIKLENIVIRGSKLFVIDFGYSMDTKVEEAKRFSGTTVNAAPEILKRKPGYDPFATDVFSLGTVWFSLLTGEFPFLIDDRTNHLALFGRDPPIVFPPQITLSETTKNFIRAMTSNDSASRPTMEEVRDKSREIFQQRG